jgi:hypothetical protein
VRQTARINGKMYFHSISLGYVPLILFPSLSDFLDYHHISSLEFCKDIEQALREAARSVTIIFPFPFPVGSAVVFCAYSVIAQNALAPCEALGRNLAAFPRVLEVRA